MNNRSWGRAIVVDAEKSAVTAGFMAGSERSVALNKDWKERGKRFMVPEGKGLERDEKMVRAFDSLIAT